MKEFVLGVVIGVYLLAPLYLAVVLQVIRPKLQASYKYQPFLTIQLLVFVWRSMRGSDRQSSLIKKITNRWYACRIMLKETADRRHKNSQVLIRLITYYSRVVIIILISYPIRCLQYAMWYLQDNVHAGIAIDYLLFDNWYNLDSSFKRSGR